MRSASALRYCVSSVNKKPMRQHRLQAGVVRMTSVKWTKAKIKCAIEEAGWNLTKLAEYKEIDPRNFRAVWSRCVRPAEAAISELLNVPLEELWPDRYPIRNTRNLSIENERKIASQKSTRSSDRIAA